MANHCRLINKWNTAHRTALALSYSYPQSENSAFVRDHPQMLLIMDLILE